MFVYSIGFDSIILQCTHTHTHIFIYIYIYMYIYCPQQTLSSRAPQIGRLCTGACLSRTARLYGSLKSRAHRRSWPSGRCCTPPVPPQNVPCSPKTADGGSPPWWQTDRSHRTDNTPKCPEQWAPNAPTTRCFAELVVPSGPWELWVRVRIRVRVRVGLRGRGKR